MSLALQSLGWDDLRAAEFAPYVDSCVPGRVSRVDRSAADVLTADNPVRVQRRPEDPALAVGDWVTIAADARFWTLHGVLSRRTTISRAAVSGESQAHVLATNVDTVLVAVPAVPEPRVGMTERLVALAWDSGATPLVVLTKCDLATDPEGIAGDLAASAPGVEVVSVSATSAGGLDPLRAHLIAGRTYCLVGRSGAGKSTVANGLLGEVRFATREIRDDGKGRHTTSHRELVVLPAGAILADTPGLRGVGLWLGDDGLDRAFEDVLALAEECRFADCRHETEPGCVVLAAIDDGELQQRRLDSWRKLQREARWMQSRSDARLRAEERARWKTISREARGRIRP